MSEKLAMPDVLERLERVLPQAAPDLWQSLRPPCAEPDLDALRNAVEPYELPEDYVQLLKWHDGQIKDSPWWPVLDSGHLLSAQEAIEKTRRMRKACKEPWQWSDSWLAITHASWNQAAIELRFPLRGMLVDAGFPDPRDH
jgi:cell wall assembly regulator SMI1